MPETFRQATKWPMVMATAKLRRSPDGTVCIRSLTTTTAMQDGDGSGMSRTTVVFAGEPDISRLSRFMESTGWRLIKKGESNEKDRGISCRIGSSTPCDDGLLSRQYSVESGAGACRGQSCDDRSRYQDDADSGDAEGEGIPV